MRAATTTVVNASETASTTTSRPLRTPSGEQRECACTEITAKALRRRAGTASAWLGAMFVAAGFRRFASAPRTRLDGHRGLRFSRMNVRPNGGDHDCQKSDDSQGLLPSRTRLTGGDHVKQHSLIARNPRRQPVDLRCTTGTTPLRSERPERPAQEETATTQNVDQRQEAVRRRVCHGRGRQ